MKLLNVGAIRQRAWRASTPASLIVNTVKPGELSGLRASADRATHGGYLPKAAPIHFLNLAARGHREAIRKDDYGEVSWAIAVGLVLKGYT